MLNLAGNSLRPDREIPAREAGQVARIAQQQHSFVRWRKAYWTAPQAQCQAPRPSCLALDYPLTSDDQCLQAPMLFPELAGRAMLAKRELG